MSEGLWIALITALATLAAASAPKWIEQTFGARKQQSDTEKSIRDELRKTIESKDGEIDELDQDREKWRERYYDMRERYVEMQNKYSLTVMILRANSLDHLVANINAPLEVSAPPAPSKETPPAKEAPHG